MDRSWGDTHSLARKWFLEVAEGSRSCSPRHHPFERVRGPNRRQIQDDWPPLCTKPRGGSGKHSHFVVPTEIKQGKKRIRQRRLNTGNPKDGFYLRTGLNTSVILLFMASRPSSITAIKIKCTFKFKAPNAKNQDLLCHLTLIFCLKLI